MSYKLKNNFEYRKQESYRLRSKYSDRIPVIVEPNSKKDLCINKRKFLVPNEFNIGQLVYVLRKQMNLSPEKSLFLFINDTMPSVSATLNDIYNEHADTDKFLYCKYTTEHMTFG